MPIDAPSPPTLEGFDPLSPEFLADPYPMLARARREAPVFYHPGMDLWVITRHDDLVTAVNDFETFSSRATGVVPPPADLAPRVPRNLMNHAFISIDPPEHTVSRKNINRGFTRGRVAALEPDITEIAHALIDGFTAAGACDLMRDYCYPLSLEVIIRLLGMPPGDAPRFRQWTEDMFSLMGPVDANDPDATTTKPMAEDERRRRWTNMAQAYEYYTAFVEERIANPGDDLTSALVQLTDDEGRPAISPERISTHIMELVAAGNDTTANLMGFMVRFFDADREQLDAVREDPALMENAVEEGLRRRGTSPGLFRITTRDVEIGGTVIPKGALVWLVYVSAGHDEALFTDPERFDVRRENAGKHMSFGRGRHMCMGAPLARLEARIGLNVLYERIPSLRVVANQSFSYDAVMTVVAMKSLLVEWDR